MPKKKYVMTAMANVKGDKGTLVMQLPTLLLKAKSKKWAVDRAKKKYTARVREEFPNVKACKIMKPGPPFKEVPIKDCVIWIDGPDKV